MSDKDFIAEIRHGIMCIVRAMIKKYCLSWGDFLPKGMSFRDMPLNIDVTERAE